MVHRLLSAAVLALVVLLCVPVADAAPITRKKSMWGPVERNGLPQFPVYADLGVGIWQTSVHWDDVAPRQPARPRDPADPAYRWPAEVDRALAQGAEHGIEVSVMLIGAPRWANGGKDWRWAPRSPRTFADFAAAASRRWPAVRHWMIWGEPSKAQNFQPLRFDERRPVRGRGRRGPRIYARMLDAAYGALKRVSRRNRVIGGNTYTVGTIAPLHYIRALKLPNGRPPRMDLWGHNPFSLREPNLRDDPVPGGYADFNDLDTLQRALDRAMRRAPLRRQRRLKLFLSEYSLPTDHANHEFNFFVTQETQMRWLRRALRIVRRLDRVYTFGYVGLYDDPLRPEGDQVERGLLRRDGSRKPAYYSFRAG